VCCPELQWENAGINGASRWIGRLWSFVTSFLREQLSNRTRTESEGADVQTDEKAGKEVLALTHETIVNVTKALEAPPHSFNAAVADLMKLSNKLSNLSVKSPQYYLSLRSLILLLHPLAPHVSSEMWQALVKYGPAHESAWAGSSSAGDISMQRWPIANADMMQKEEVVVAVQLNGKTRGTFLLPAAEAGNSSSIERYARESDVGKRALREKVVKKTIIPPNGKIINFVC